MNRGAILALDTSPKSHFSIALRHAQKQPRRRVCEIMPGMTGRGHVEILAPAIAALMAEEKTDFSDLSAIAVTTGPGSFSGVRAGCATARALAQAARLPVIGISLMELWAGRAAEDCVADAEDVLLAVLPAGANLFLQAFRLQFSALRPVEAAASRTVQEAVAHCREFDSLVLLGSGADRLAAALEKDTASSHHAMARAKLDAGMSWHIPSLAQPDAVLLADMAAQREPAADFPIPLYVRPPDARMPQEARKTNQAEIST